MKRTNIFLFTSVIVLLLVGCSDPGFINPPPQEQLVIHCVLLASQPRQKLWISKVVANDDSPYIFFNDITVSINNIAFSVNDSVAWQDPYNFYSDHLQVIPGHSYVLVANSPAYNEIRGEATVPGNFEIFSDTAAIKWTRSIHAYGYLVDMINLGNSEVFSATVQDTLFHLPPHMSSGWYNVTIRAVDPNYFRYMIQKEQTAGLQGAYGMMGALVAKTKTVYVKA